MNLQKEKKNWLTNQLTWKKGGKAVLLGASLFISLGAAAQGKVNPNSQTFSGPPVKKATPKKPFIDKSNMDLSVKPGQDFYTYASGNWIRKNPVPAKETRWGSFNVLRDFNINAVKTILNESAKNTKAAPGSVERRVGDFYAAGMDSVTIDKLGYSPIKADLQKAASVKSVNEVLDQAAVMRTTGIGSPLFGFFVGQDRKKPTNMVPQLSQGGTTLPDRDYYLKNDPRNIKIQEAYKNYITKLFTLTGVPQATAEKNAETIFNLEKKLAASQMARVEMRDPYKTYNKFAIADLTKTTSNIDWKPLMAKMKVTGQDTVLVNSPKFFTDLNSLLNATPVADWQTYLQWNVLKSAAPNLSTPFVNANFAFTQVLTGQKVQTPRWQRMSSQTDGTVGELLGQLYVKKHFKVKCPTQ